MKYMYEYPKLFSGYVFLTSRVLFYYGLIQAGQEIKIIELGRN